MTEAESAKLADGVQDRIARYAADFAFADLPDETVHAATMRILDTFGALIGGFHQQPSRLARQAARWIGCGDEATLLGTAEKARVEMAAFANSSTARYAELNDTYHWPGSSGGHPSDMITPLFAVAEWRHASGADLIAAVTLAYEIYLRIADKTQLSTSNFDHVNMALIGNTIGTGRLLGMSYEQIRQALSIAVVPNIATRQGRIDDLTMWKAVASGQAGLTGINAARLADVGLQGALRPFEGRAGWLNVVTGGTFQLDVLGGGETPYKIGTSIMKRRGCCGTTISSALAAEDAYRKLRDAGGGSDDIAAVQIDTYYLAWEKHGKGRHHWTPTTRETADHSVPYVAAVALVDGMVGPNQFDDAHLVDPNVRRVLDVLEVVEKPEFTDAYMQMPQQHRTSVRVTTKSGNEVVGESGGEHGDVGDVWTDHELEEKFIRLTHEFLGLSRARSAADRLWKLREVADVAELATAVVG